jgi:hypothetical protein
MTSIQNQRHYSAAEWSSYADKELPEAQRRHMQSHLAKCAECAALARSYEAVQRGAEELARRAAPPPSGLRSRVLSVGAALVQRQQTRWFWLTTFALALVAGMVLAGLWIALRQEPQSAIGPVVDRTDAKKVQFRIEQIRIEPVPLPPGVFYEVTFDNGSGTTLEISSVKVTDPYGGFGRTFDPAVEVPSGVRRSGHGFRAPYLLGPDEELRDGVYRMEISTNLGTFSAEREIRGRSKH